MYHKPEITMKEIADKINVSESTVEKRVSKLKTSGLISHIGPTKSGYWKLSIEK
jgi:ATP-dependent DNA helicase RecG